MRQFCNSNTARLQRYHSSASMPLQEVMGADDIDGRSCYAESILVRAFYQRYSDLLRDMPAPEENVSGVVQTGAIEVDSMGTVRPTNAVARFYHYVFTELSDPRTNDWPLIGNPMHGLLILGAYLYFVLSWGPRFMENRKPYKLNRLLIVYNFIQVYLSTWLFWEAMEGAWLFNYSWKCQPVNFSNTPEGLREARGVYIYFLAKISELLDTIFFVLRKKQRQITFLHLYHHTVMPMISWGATKYYPGGHGTFIGVINSFVHIIMYFYYMVSAMGPQYQKYVWWKKYITTLQMGQFCLAFIHSFQLVFYDCGFPRWSVYLVLPNAVFFYLLFNDFYKKCYSSEGAEKAKTEALKKD